MQISHPGFLIGGSFLLSPERKLQSEEQTHPRSPGPSRDQDSEMGGSADRTHQGSPQMRQSLTPPHTLISALVHLLSAFISYFLRSLGGSPLFSKALHLPHSPGLGRPWCSPAPQAFWSDVSPY